MQLVTCLIVCEKNYCKNNYYIINKMFWSDDKAVIKESFKMHEMSETLPSR